MSISDDRGHRRGGRTGSLPALDKALDRRRVSFRPVSSSEPPELLRRWESLSTGVQAAIVFPPLAVLLFLLNLGGFGQPLGRSILYGLIEAAPVTALVLVATANERRKRTGR